MSSTPKLAGYSSSAATPGPQMAQSVATNVMPEIALSSFVTGTDGLWSSVDGPAQAVYAGISAVRRTNAINPSTSRPLRRRRNSSDPEVSPG